VAVLEREEDRRGSPRRPLYAIPRVAAVKVSSEVVDVINASSSGLLVEGAFPVRPGMTSYVDLIEAAGTTVRVNGSIVRCHIASLGPNKPRYRFAIVFDRPVPMMDEGRETPATDQELFGFVIEGADVCVDPNQSLNNW
jgi:hypothetical protein